MEGYTPEASSFFSVAKKDSATALSQQLALRLILGTKPRVMSMRRKSWLAYWLPRSEWNNTPPSVQEGLLDQVIRHAVAEAVAQHLPSLESQHDRQVQPALTSGDVGDVADPGRRRAGHVEPPVQQVLGHRPRVTAVRGARSGTAFGLAAQAFFPHQSRDALGADRMAQLTQVGEQPGTPIQPSAFGVAALEVTA